MHSFRFSISVLLLIVGIAAILMAFWPRPGAEVSDDHQQFSWLDGKRGTLFIDHDEPTWVLTSEGIQSDFGILALIEFRISRGRATGPKQFGIVIQMPSQITTFKDYPLSPVHLGSISAKRMLKDFEIAVFDNFWELDAREVRITEAQIRIVHLDSDLVKLKLVLETTHAEFNYDSVLFAFQRNIRTNQ